MLLLLTACLDYTERIDISRDGAATIYLKLRIAPTFHTLLRTNPAFKALAMLTDEQQLAENLPQGLTLRKHVQAMTGGREVYINELYAPDASKLRANGSPVFSGQSFTMETKPDGTLHYQRRLNFTSAMQDPKFAEMLRENKLGIVSILKSAPFTFQVASPLKVLSTNGVEQDGVVTWSYDLYSLLNQPVEQDIVFAPPTATDRVLGALRMMFEPRYFPILAVVLLGLFFVVVRRRAH